MLLSELSSCQLEFCHSTGVLPQNRSSATNMEPGSQLCSTACAKQAMLCDPLHGASKALQSSNGMVFHTVPLRTGACLASRSIKDAAAWDMPLAPASMAACGAE